VWVPSLSFIRVYIYIPTCTHVHYVHITYTTLASYQTGGNDEASDIKAMPKAEVKRQLKAEQDRLEEQGMHFKLRVLDCMEVYCKAVSRGNPLMLRSIEGLLNIAMTTPYGKSSKDLQEKCSTFLRRCVFKASPLLGAAVTQDAELNAEALELLETLLVKV
jgi:hypothetical protein